MGTKHIVPRAEGQGGIGTATLGWGELFITNTTADSSTQGGKLTLTSNDGAAMQDGSRLGVIEFKGAESSSALTIGARIEAICDAAWTATENGTSLKFFTTDADASESLVLTLDSNKLATFAGNVVISGNMTVNGTTTTVNSTIVTIDDPVFTLGGDTPPASETTKDKGIEFRYHTGSAAKIGFFGWDDDASSFTFIADATNNSEVFSGSAGNVIFGNITGTLQTAAQGNVTSLGTLTGLTISGDLTLTGASYNVVWDKSDNALEFSDDSILRIGDGSDLEIFHSSNVNFLKTQTNSVLKFVSASDADILKLTPNGAVDLYFNNNLVLTTTNSGIKIPNSGNIGCTSDTDLMTLASGVLTIAGELDATSLDISGDADIDGTLEADAITVNDVALNTVIAGVTVTNATNAATVTGAAQSNITSLGTLTTLTVDDITIDGSTISDGGDITIDAAGGIILDADSSGTITIKDNTVTAAFLYHYSTVQSGDFGIYAGAADKDIYLQGSSGGSTVNALHLDMSASGLATFAGNIKIPNDGTIGSAGTAGAIAIDSSGNTTFSGNTSANVVTSRDNMFVVAGQFYIGADNGSTDDTYRQSVSSGIFKIESRESGTWTDRFNISSAGAATFSNNLFARRGSFGTASNFSFDLYNNGTSYFNGAVTIDDNATITNSGNIKIGSSTTVTPATQADDIVIDKGASESGITIVSTAAASLRFGDAASASVGYIEYNHSSNAFSFGTNGATRLTISSAGDVKVTSGSFYNSVSGITKIGNAGDYEFIDALGSGTRRFRPATDDAIDIGDASHRFDDIFATNGTINTSDKNQKNTITESDLGLDFVKKLLPKSYKFNNKTRTHYGLISQDVEDLLSDISKDTQDFAGFIKSPKDIDDKNNSEFIYGLRYNEFIAPMIKAIQEQQVIIEDLKSRIEALEG